MVMDERDGWDEWHELALHLVRREGLLGPVEECDAGLSYVDEFDEAIRDQYARGVRDGRGVVVDDDEAHHVAGDDKVTTLADLGISRDRASRAR